MDLNVLLRAHQIQVMKANACGDDGRRQNYLDNASHHAAEIRALRIAPRPEIPMPARVSAGTLNYGSYAWDPPSEPNAPLDSSDNEGGAIDSPKDLMAADGLLYKFTPPAFLLRGARQ